MRTKIQTHRQKSYGFKCVHCKQVIQMASAEIGTDHRDHCPFCLFSLHVDYEKPGDRKSTCYSKMKPIGLTFKINSSELMIVYECLGCGKLSKNRCAGDDAPFALVDVFRFSLIYKQSKNLSQAHISLASKQDSKKVLGGIYGLGYIPNELLKEFNISVV